MRALLLLLATSAAFADDAAILDCRKLPDASQRLACYDAMTVPATGGATAGTRARQAPEQFGMSQPTPQAIEVKAIESHIQGRFEGWEPSDRIRFANGQVWQISDNSRAVFDAMNPKVRVHRGLMGAFFLEIEGTSRTPKVRRVQ